MSVQFIIGRAGSGKSAWCSAQTISECRADRLGPPILWLAPAQATFQIERDFCCGPELNGFFRIRVMSFELLCRDVLAEVNGAAATEVSAAGRQMILGHLLRKHQNELKYFQSVASGGGLACELAATLDELERGGADLTALASKLTDTGNVSLIDKAEDLQLIHGAYNKFLGQQRLDPLRRLQQATESFARSRLVRQAKIHVDGFLQFTHHERQMLTALAAVCESMHVTLTIDPQSPVIKNVHYQPDDLSLFHRTEREYSKLSLAFSQSAIKLEPPILLNQTHRFQTPELRLIEQWTEAPPPAATSASSAVELIECPDKRAEVSAAARRIRDWAAGGMRYRDIAVSCRQLSDYQDLIGSAFAEHGIPYFVDERRTAAHHPLIQFLRAALGVAAAPWPREEMVTLIKSGLCGLSSQQADELENQLLLEGGDRSFWSKPKGTIDYLPRLIIPLKALADAVNKSLTARQFSEAIFAFLETMQVRRTLAEWITAAGPEESAQHEQVWAETLNLFSQLVELLGDVPMPLAEFGAVLEGALQSFDLAIAPATVDQVLVGQVDRTRTPAIAAAIVLGLSDGQFPRTPPPSTILTDADRRSLADFAELEPNSQRRALDEEFLGYFAFTRPSRWLIATRPIADSSGRELSPGSLWRKLRALVPAATPTIAARPDDPNAGDISTPRQLISGLMQWGRRWRGEESSSWPGLYQWLALRPRTGDAIDQLRDLAWGALGYTNRAELSPDLAARLFPSPLDATARQLESFAACPFQHFAQHALKLSPRVCEGFTGIDLSRLCHQILSHRLDWVGMEPEELEVHLGELSEAIGHQLKGERMLSVARNRHQLTRAQSMLTQTIAAQRVSAARSKFQVTSVQIRYGPGGTLPALRVGDHLLISGAIDRADTTPDGRAAIIYDYRISAGALSLQEVYHGLSIKLLAHLLVWEQSQSSRAAAALSLSIARPLSNTDDPSEALDPSDDGFVLRVKPRGIIDENFVLDIDMKLLPNSESDVINVQLKMDANPANRHRTDVATSAEFKALVSHVRQKLTEIAAGIRGGVIAVRPYKLGKQTPCANCGYRDVCRFVPSEGYAFLKTMKRLDVLKAVMEEHP